MKSKNVGILVEKLKQAQHLSKCGARTVPQHEAALDGPCPQGSDPGGLQSRLRICFPRKLPGDIGAAGPRTTD